MTNTNIMSDSQESALIDDETFKDIEQQFGGSLPIEDFRKLENEEPFVLQDINDTSNNTYDVLEPAVKFKRMKEEDDEMYFPAPELFSTMLTDDIFTGSLNFQSSLGTGGNGQDWVYSETLGKLFIKMEKVLPMRFTWEPPLSGLYLRSSMIFMVEQYRSDPVKRCHNHMALTNAINQNMESHKIQHVVHCVNHASTIYQERNEHLSILTPLCTPEPGSQYVPVSFKFLCKNSCPSGLNRRPTELVFTLEDNRGTIMGRQKLLVRVCSCPKRDMMKEEKELIQVTNKRKLSNITLPNMSVKKISSCDMHVYKVDLNILGKENYLSILKNAFDIMAGQAARTGQYECFKPYMDDILHKMP